MDLDPTEYQDITLLPSKDTIYHDVVFELGDPKPTITHEVELNYIPADGEGGQDHMTIIAKGELIEPEILIKTQTEDILVERIHPAYIVANPEN